MIYVYNENPEEAWKIYKKNDSYNRIESTKMTYCGIDVLSIDENIKLEDINEQALAITESSERILKFCEMKTEVRHDYRGLRPYIQKSYNDKNNTNIVFASFDISEGMKLLNHSEYSACIYSFGYDYKKKALSVIFSFKTDKSDHGNVEFVLQSEDGRFLYTKGFYFNNKTSQTKKGHGIRVSDHVYDLKETPVEELNRRIHMEDKSINGRYFIRTYVPLRPTRNVVIETEDDREVVNKLITDKFHLKLDKMKVINANDPKAKLRTVLKSIIEKDRTSVITYYMNDKDFKEVRENADAIYEELLKNRCANYFMIVMVLAKDGRVVRIH